MSRDHMHLNRNANIMPQCWWKSPNPVHIITRSVITSSISNSPHSLFLISSIIFSDSSDRLPPKATMLYVVTTTPALPRNLSLLSDVKRQIWSSRMVDHNLNWNAHWSTETAFVAKQRQLFLIRDAAETPTRDFPAPQGKTIMPDLALPAKLNNHIVHSEQHN